MPIAAISTATAANAPSSVALSRGCAALADSHSSIVRTVASGSSPSISCTFCRSAGSSVSGGTSARTTTSISGHARVDSG